MVFLLKRSFSDIWYKSSAHSDGLSLDFFDIFIGVDARVAGKGPETSWFSLNIGLNPFLMPISSRRIKSRYLIHNWWSRILS